MARVKKTSWTKKPLQTAGTLTAKGDYLCWVGELKKRYRATQIKAAIAVNRYFFELYTEKAYRPQVADDKSTKVTNHQQVARNLRRRLQNPWTRLSQSRQYGEIRPYPTRLRQTRPHAMEVLQVQLAKCYTDAEAKCAINSKAAPTEHKPISRKLSHRK